VCSRPTWAAMQRSEKGNRALHELPSSWKRDLVWGLMLFAATLLAYRPAWNGSPLWDDRAHMTPPALRSFHGLEQIWTHPKGTVQYYPLAHTVFWLQSHLWGDSTLGYHLLNILLHVLSALLLVAILRKLGIRGAWLAAAIFALHPVQVESVAWITELKNTLSGVFFLATALTYLTYIESRKRLLYGSALGLFALGLISKTSIAPFPLAMLAVVWWKRGKLSWKQDIVPLLPFLLTGVSFGLITLYVEQTFIGVRGEEFALSFVERCLIAGRALWFYLSKVFFPVNLVFSYPHWTVSESTWWQYLFPAAALAAGAALLAKRKVWRAPAAALFFFTAMLLPCLGFFSLFTFRYSFVADHYQYLAMIGPITVAAATGVRGTDLLREKLRRKVGPLLCATLLSVLFMLSWRQSHAYADAWTLYRTTLRNNPDSWMAYNNLGLLLADIGRSDEAMTDYKKALAINPDASDVHYNLGLLLAKMGRADEAMADYQTALRLNPNHPSAHNNLGALLERMGRTDEAMAHYLKALELYRDHAEAHTNLGVLLGKMGRSDEALAHLSQALEIDPDYRDAQYNIGLLLAKMGRTDEAMVHLQKVLELDSNYVKAHNTLGALLAQLGRIDEATDHFREALKMEPGAVGTQYNLALALAQKGQLAEAIPLLEKVLASAKANGDAAMEQRITQILASMQEASQGHSQSP
jgi:protein O-mannosyl-transferase